MPALILNLLLLCTRLSVPAGHAPDTKIRLVFHHMIGNEALVLGSSYVNAVGDTITIQKFKYYLSNFSVRDNQGNNITLPQQYFLVDEADSASRTIELTVPGKQVAGIRFMIGVDSIKNVSGIQEGPLDPLKGMFWTWNTGYINAKLEGSSPSSKIAMQSFTYHVGGYRSPFSTMRWVDMDLPGNNPKEININADINRWFKSKTELYIAKTPVCHSTGALAARIADNFSSMFYLSPTP